MLSDNLELLKVAKYLNVYQMLFQEKWCLYISQQINLTPMYTKS